MGITKKKILAKTHSKKSLTKRQKTKKRSLKIHKLLQSRKKLKKQKKKNIVSLKSKLNQQAEDEIIDLNTKTDIQGEVTNQQNNILALLGLNQDEEGQWEKQLQAKLKEINSKSLDNPEVRRVYGEIGRIFSTYRSGKIPKAFKIIPNLEKWTEILALTRPEEWTPQAMYQAVNIFASNFDPVRAEQFYMHYLVPAIRVDLNKNKKLNYHYFESLKKALYKTNAWFKGILFQFCSTETSLKEIKVLQALILKMTIPVISSSVALIKITEMQACTATIHYLLALVSKHYNFPKKVINILVNYLLKFKDQTLQLPVVWHQLMLNFVKQYSSSLDGMSRGCLEELAKHKCHKIITPQILKVLASSIQID